MALAIDIFKAIDVVMNRKQNNCPLATKKDLTVVCNDIVYDSGNEKVCKLDTYVVPKDQGLYPVLFYIHGGGFVAGGKQYRRGVSYWYATNGFFVVNVDYGLSPDYKFPEPIRHLASAVNWVADNAADLRLDLSKFIVAGDSAGAYYAALLAETAYDKRLQKKLDAYPALQFKAAVLNCGLYDIEAVREKRIILSLDEKLFGDFTGVKMDDFDKYKYRDACEPIKHITKKFPPTFLIYAKKDVFCGGQAERLVEKFKEKGVYFERVFSNALTSNHCYCLDWTDSDAVVANTLTMDFVEKFLKGKIK